MSHSLQTHVALLTEVNKSSSLLLGLAHCVSFQSFGSTKSTQPTVCVGDWHQHQLQLTKPALQTHRSTSKATPRGRCSSGHVCSTCKLKSSFLQSQLTSRAGMGRAHLKHLCPTGSWITRGNHKPPDAGAHLVVLFTISVSVAYRCLQQEPDLPLLCPFHDKSFYKALALELAKVDEKYHKPNGTAGKKTTRNLLKCTEVSCGKN